jgi:hypothetical protein
MKKKALTSENSSNPPWSKNLPRCSTATESPSFPKKENPMLSCLSVYKDLEKRLLAQNMHITGRRKAGERPSSVPTHSEQALLINLNRMQLKLDVLSTVATPRQIQSRSQKKVSAILKEKGTK